MGVTFLVGVIDSKYQGEIWLLLHNDDKEDSVWNSLWGEWILGCLLVLSCSVVKFSGKLQQPQKGRMIEDSDSLGIEV